MGATSVTGVGPGDSAGFQKGSDTMSLGVHRLIGPRVVGAGQVTLNVSGNATVYYPPLVATTASYVIQLSSDKSTLPYWGSFTTTSFAITGGASAHVHWLLAKTGIWGSTTTGQDAT